MYRRTLASTNFASLVAKYFLETVEEESGIGEENTKIAKLSFSLRRLHCHPKHLLNARNCRLERKIGTKMSS